MKYEHTGYNRLLVGEIDHWDKDQYDNLNSRDKAGVRT